MKVLFFKEGRKMLTKKKKIFILGGMLLLLVVTGFLNYTLNKEPVEQATTTATTSFFITYRTERLSARDSQLEILNQIIENNNVALAEKTVAIQAKTELAQKIEKELILEGLIKAKGFEDAVVTIGSNFYNVIVKNADALTSSENAQILSVVTSETGCLATNVKIIQMN